MQRLEVSGAVRPTYGSLGVKRLTHFPFIIAVFQFIFTIETIARCDWLMQGRKCSFFMCVRVQYSFCGSTGESMGCGKTT